MLPKPKSNKANTVCGILLVKPPMMLATFMTGLSRKWLFLWMIRTLVGASVLTVFSAKSFCQDPNDPLVFAPGISVGARLQYGTNAYPSDWTIGGKFVSSISENLELAGYKLETLTQPKTKTPTVIPDGFEEVPCDFLGTTPIVTVYSQNGEKHRFTLDTGALLSYVRPSVAELLNSGRDDPIPMAFLFGHQRWVHFLTRVDRNISILSSQNSDFPADGILGMNAIACLQLKIDYVKRKLWARLSPKALNLKIVDKEFGDSVSIETVPITKRSSGRFTIDAILNGSRTPVEVDTGANVLGLSSKMTGQLTLEKVGEGEVLVEAGSKRLSRYLASNAKIADITFLWPIIHEGQTEDQDVGGFGPSVLPHQIVVIDFPGLQLYTQKPTEDELVAQAAGQLISGVVRFDKSEVLLDLPDVVGKSRAVLLKIQDQKVNTVIEELHAWKKGDTSARTKLLALYRQLNSGGHITIRQNGQEKLIQVSP